MSVGVTDLARQLKALGHPIRLRLIALLASQPQYLYLNEIAKALDINRALAKIHLIKLENAGLVRSRIILVEGEARALRYYELQDFDIRVSPTTLKQKVMKNGK
ncbi:MAG: ArsR/SmtB family transcription factor [Candidatus Thorarchaeota archaeon]|jgi:DNA-binding transcriptional ArsR family regulator